MRDCMRLIYALYCTCCISWIPDDKTIVNNFNMHKYQIKAQKSLEFHIENTIYSYFWMTANLIIVDKPKIKSCSFN